MSQAASVSIVIPSYNDERFIGEALRSVFAQTYVHWHAIVVDDGSTDDSVKIARSFGERVTVIEQSNAGSAVARNRGIAAASGEFVAFLDADDYWLPHKLQQQVAYMNAHSDCSFVYCGWHEWRWPSTADPDKFIDRENAASLTLDIDARESGWLYSQLLLDCRIQTSTVLVRRSLLQTVGDFDVSLRRGQDYDLWLRCAQVTPIHKLAATHSLYRLREDSITKRVHPVNYGGVLLERAIARWGMRDPRGVPVSTLKVRRHLGKVWRDYSFGHATADQYKVAFVAIFRALRWWPFDYVSWLCLIRYLFPPLRPKRSAGP